MALVTSVTYFPDHMVQSTGSSIAYNALLMDASGEQAGLMVAAPKSGAIHKVHWRTGAVTTPTNTDVRIESVSTTTGKPTGNLFGTNTNGTQLSAAITANTWQTTTLTADATVVVGDMLAIVIAPTGSPNFEAVRMSTMLGAGSGAYTALKTGGSWGTLSSSPPVVALEYSDGTFEFTAGACPFSALFATAINSGNTPDEIAAKFVLPFAARVHGARVLLTTSASTTIVFNLYDSADTVVATATLDTDQTLTGSVFEMLIHFTASADLLPGTYRLGVQPQTATNVTVHGFSVASASILDAVSGGRVVSYSQRTNAGAWSDTATSRLFASLQIERLADAQGTGGPGLAIPSIGSLSR